MDLCNERLHAAVDYACRRAGRSDGWNARFILAVESAGLIMVKELPEGASSEDWIQAPVPVEGQDGEWFGVRYLIMRPA